MGAIEALLTCWRKSPTAKCIGRVVFSTALPLAQMGPFSRDKKVASFETSGRWTLESFNSIHAFGWQRVNTTQRNSNRIASLLQPSHQQCYSSFSMGEKIFSSDAKRSEHAAKNGMWRGWGGSRSSFGSSIWKRFRNSADVLSQQPLPASLLPLPTSACSLFSCHFPRNVG